MATRWKQAIDLWRLPGALRALAAEANPAAAALGRAIDASRHPELSPEAREWVRKLEAHRSRLNASEEEIERVDFGAGKPGDERTPEEQRRGVVVVDSLGRVARTTSKPPFWSLLLFDIVREMRPARVLEMGTSVGISAAYQAAALKLNGAGRLVTLEGDATVAAIAERGLGELGLGDVAEVVVGNFLDTLPRQLEGPALSFAFIDGHHDEHATVGYFERIRTHVTVPAVLAFDDIRWSAGMSRAWDRISHDDAVTCAVDLGPIGLCVIGGPAAARREYRLPLGLAARRYERGLARQQA